MNAYLLVSVSTRGLLAPQVAFTVQDRQRRRRRFVSAHNFHLSALTTSPHVLHTSHHHACIPPPSAMLPTIPEQWRSCSPSSVPRHGMLRCQSRNPRAEDLERRPLPAVVQAESLNLILSPTPTTPSYPSRFYPSPFPPYPPPHLPHIDPLEPLLRPYLPSAVDWRTAHQGRATLTRNKAGSMVRQCTASVGILPAGHHPLYDFPSSLHLTFSHPRIPEGSRTRGGERDSSMQDSSKYQIQ